MCYGFYSKIAESIYGCSIYLNENNEEVKVTYVTKDPFIGYFKYLWKDKEFVGPLIKHVRNCKGAKNWRPPWLSEKMPKSCLWAAQNNNELE